MATIGNNGYEQNTETVVSIDEIIRHDLEGFLDLLDELTNPSPSSTYVDDDGQEWELEPLTDTGFEAIGISDEGTIRLRVTGFRGATLVEGD